VLRVRGKGSIITVCQDFEDCFLCKMDVISVCRVRVCREFFFSISWACNFWMVGVMRETF